ncbi:MAG TPA: ABC-F family ATP-binding cassette domain-containing protein [Actinomycetota bacterium]|nr:ABC-F family ATP-binding cassette domain-containing protein [Actinomycetota bacterium]
MRYQSHTSSGTLNASGVTKSHGAQVVLDQVDLTVASGDRIGVVGPNGVGKSTLLRILAGVEKPDSGRTLRSPATLSVGYLAQEPDLPRGLTLLELLAQKTGVAVAEAEVDRLALAMENDESLAGDYSEALDRFIALGGGDFEPRAEAVLGELGLPADRLRLPVRALSGGQAARAELAAVLLSRFDVLLLDEPTNNLDFEALDLLERFVSEVPAGVVVVSHDRAFLERTVSRILELEEGTHRAVEYSGGYSAYLEHRATALRHQYEDYEQFVSQRSELEQRVRRVRQWAEKGARKARADKSEPDKHVRTARIESSEKQASKVKSLEKRLDRLDPVDKPFEAWRLRLSLEAVTRSGNVVARLEQAVVRRGSFTLGPLDLEVTWGERVAIIGPNGSGKTTLLHALLGRTELDAGARWMGPGVVVGEMDQHRGAFAGDESLLDEFSRRSDLVPQEARSMLAKLGLGASHVTRPGGSLSPGERTRAVLGLVSVSGMNCLVMDEPTNHLDLPAIEQIEQALEDFEGTLLLVTHDRRMLETLRTTRTIRVVPRDELTSVVETR